MEKVTCPECGASTSVANTDGYERMVCTNCGAISPMPKPKPAWMKTIDSVPEAEPTQEEQSEVLRKGLAFITRIKLPTPRMEPKEIEDIVFPKDVSALSNDHLTTSMGEWTNLMTYTQFELAKLSVEASALQNEYDRARAMFMARFNGSKEEAKRAADTDDELEAMLMRAEVAKAKHTLMEALFKGYGQNYRVLSRELTKRGLILPGELGNAGRS